MADITLPPKFITKDDFIANWFSWKNNFFICMKHIDKTETNKHLWGIMLLNRMGPVGQEIHRTFPFYNRNDTDINILIKKFDIYCIYGDRRRNGKSIDEYIINLKLIAIKHNYLDPTSIVKEKIIQEITTRRFRGQAAHVIRSKGKNLIPYLQSLDLNNIIRFWKYCEDLMPPKKGKKKNKIKPKQEEKENEESVKPNIKKELIKLNIEKEFLKPNIKKEPIKPNIEEKPKKPNIEKELVKSNIEKEPEKPNIEKELVKPNIKKEPIKPNIEKEPKKPNIEKELEKSNIEKEPEKPNIEKERKIPKQYYFLDIPVIIERLI